MSDKGSLAGALWGVVSGVLLIIGSMSGGTLRGTESSVGLGVFGLAVLLLSAFQLKKRAEN